MSVDIKYQNIDESDVVNQEDNAELEDNILLFKEEQKIEKEGEIDMTFEHEISLKDLEKNIEKEVVKEVEPDEDMLITKTAFFEKLNELSFDEKLENLKYAEAGLVECKEEFANIKTERDAIEARRAELEEKYNDLVEVEAEIKKRYNELLMSLVIPDDKKNNLDGLLKDINYFIQQLDDEE